MKKSKRGLAKKRLSSAVRSQTRRLRHSHAAATPATPNHAAPVKAAPSDVPRDLVEGQQTDELNNMPPVMLVITVLAVLFISLITWFVAQMPAK